MTATRFSGETILVTRPVDQADTFVQQLRGQGANAISLSALSIQPPSSWHELDQQLSRLSEFDWLILTSANGVKFFIERLRSQGYSLQDIATVKIAVVGRKTAIFLQQKGLTPDFIPPQFISDSLVEHFPDRDHLNGAQILYPCLEDERRDLLITELSRLGAVVWDVPAYRSACPEDIEPDTLQALKQGIIDVVTFASPKTVRCFQQLLQAHQNKLGALPEQLLEKVAIASIGPLTSEACQEIFSRVDIQPNEYSLNGLTAALIQWAAARGSAFEAKQTRLPIN
ncbi:uroporphyrinogen-III synthase [Leptolyngbyaceae cyanobacterium CCMR0082]|uniref:Uroporphyrinogen-III synthase n=1 Tax=Adonisia turfae CCMR0082 TaxID=2304604 RepID=A0A6M0S7F9_9CYAN|nr:uroporphyrinogen-III synthase [Adonisia turfae]MDV3348890.1 uroporphyrinogen-III synthase [Leptothoe sp. LEGE 181152]NEZ64023.1 uroporphyrinogen-III synthase [Adonisia turfae CCMR0082]